MTIDHSDKFYVLSQDVSIGVMETSDILTSLAMTSRIGMWGESMFGDVLILGTGSVIISRTDSGKNVISQDLSINTTRLPVTLFTLTMLSRPGMWGEEMFGSSDLLGTGSLNLSEG